MAERRRRSVKTRNWTKEDIPALVELQKAVYSDAYEEGMYGARVFEMELAAFPEGQFVAELDGKIVGYTATLIVNLAEDTFYTFIEITGNGTFTTHNPAGDTLYGADMAVHPDYRGLGVARKLYSERKRLLRRFNLRRMIAGGRIPGYREFAGKLTPEQYVEKVVAGELTDPTLTPQLKIGYRVKAIYMDYSTDLESLNYATLIEYRNPSYKEEMRRISSAPVTHPVRKVRICAAQYFMRPIHSLDEFVRQVDFYVDTASEYHCHFLVFPELFTAQLFLILAPETDDREAMRRLADFTESYKEIFQERARKTGMFIIGGSQPIVAPEGLRNVAHLFTPDGGVFTQDKLHITPSERKYYNMVPGDGIKVFDTGIARIGIQICYDVEFPEVSRLQTFAGMEALFVPFSTEHRKAYLRVRFSSQTRAIENWIYTTLAGNVGNLPQVKSFLINYGQSAILTPSDHPFPNEAVLAEAEPNTETVVISEVDLSDLQRQREYGSVRPLRDRRIDLYEVLNKQNVERIKVY
ncbi:MAG: bifunctional GNAT family N-acetyltransferase/carbon-nitrogen hydrolase family protein [Leptospiraceae bacterium]|nr:bifunctional GNAT family N-acetyltransferase/carbon-nitrogen hydrolase family protein [Leptospiraceae bacterium]